MGQNNDSDDAGQLPPDNAGMPPPPGQSDDDDSGGIMQWIEDSYNGLYKVVIEPSMPTRQTVILLLVGLTIGLIWGYGLRPVQYTGAAPRNLAETAQEQWLRIVAVGSTTSASYSPESAQALVSVIPNPEQQIQSMLQSGDLGATDQQALQNLQSIIAGQTLDTPEPVTTPGIIAQAVGLLIPFLVVLIVTPILVVVWRLLIYPNLVAGAVDQFRQATDSDYRAKREQEKAAQAAAREQAEFRRKMREEQVADAELGEPVMSNLSIFDPSRNYDESFEIELPMDQGGDFLGQCGAAIAEATDPDPVAIELWLFDMFSQQNVKSIFVTEAGWNDPSIRSRLEDDVDQDGETIKVARDGEKLTVDSDKLRLQGTMQELELTDDGRFKGFKMPVVAWQKDDAGGAPPVPQPMGAATGSSGGSTGSPSMSEYENMEFDPPPQMPGSSGGGQQSGGDQSIGSLMGNSGGNFNQQQTQPNAPASAPDDDQPLPPSSGAGSSGGGSGSGRLEPPPLNFPPGFEQGGGSSSQSNDTDDDDPFGGTGDFTPLPNRDN